MDVLDLSSVETIGIWWIECGLWIVDCGCGCSVQQCGAVEVAVEIRSSDLLSAGRIVSARCKIIQYHLLPEMFCNVF